MPDFVIRGNPGAIRERAAVTYAKGQAFFDTGDALGKITTEGWTGRAADHFRDAHDLEPERWTKAGNGFRTAGSALEVYAGAVEDAQLTAEWARGEYARGDEVTQRARAAYDADVARARNEVHQAAARGETMTLTILPFSDPGAAIRDHALSELATARTTLEAAAHTCADQVRVGCHDAPEEPGWLESGLRFVGGIFEGAGEAIWDLVTLTPFSPINMILDLHSLVTGDLTPEELMVKYRLSIETVGDLIQALRDDPVEFGKQLGKGLLDWDTWADDPARALGHLVPDIIIAIATAGAGEAAVGAEAGAGGLQGASHLDDLARLDDLADLARLDDLSHLDDLAHLDDLGDLGRLDELGDLGRFPGPSLDEADAIRAYTGSTYDDVNRYLRGLDSSGGRSLEELAELSNKISGGLQSLPPHPGETFRGTNLPQSVLDDIRPGGTFADDAFFSSSEQLSVAEEFRDGGNTIFHIEGQTGRDVQGLSIFDTSEAEILFDKGTTFEVVDKVWNPAGYWDIYLKE